MKERLFNALKALQATYPQLRLAQLIYNVTNGADIFYWTDERLLQAIENYSMAMDLPNNEEIDK